MLGKLLVKNGNQKWFSRKSKHWMIIMILSRILKNQKKENGAVQFAIMGGSLSEGVDYPNYLLNSVIIVGLP